MVDTKSSTSNLQAPVPAHSSEIIVSFPAEHVLLLTFNRPKALNAMTPTMVNGVKVVMDWFDEEPSLWVCVITGNGRAFCAGADLKAWNNDQANGTRNEQEDVATSFNGFGSLSRRSTSPKPVIAAVNGIGTFGGGTEIIMNCDLVIAAETASFTLPEAKRGVTAAQGVIPRLLATSGRQLASEMLFLGRKVSAQEAYERFRFVNIVVPSTRPVLEIALAIAKEMVENCSPDTVQAHKKGILLAMQYAGIEPATVTHGWSPESKRVFKGQNIKEGLKAFVEKRTPVWTNPAKL